MKKTVRILAISSLLTAFAFLTCSAPKIDSALRGTPRRIISLAPSITETLFALGVGNKIVGITDYCNFPPETKGKERLGGYTNPSFEKLLALKPDLVIILEEHEPIKQFCDKQRLRCLAIDNHNLDFIIESIDTLGSVVGAKHAADSITGIIRAELLPDSSSNKLRPRVLMCIDRAEPGSGRIIKAYIAGPKTFYSEILDRLNAENAFQDSSITYPVLSAEGIAHVNPDIIIDVTMNPHVQQHELVRDWQALSYIPAVKKAMLFCIDERYMTIPGPRIVLIIRKLKEVLKYYRDIPKSDEFGLK